MSTNVITKKSPTTTSTTSNTTYLSMVTPNVPTTNNNKRRESSTYEDSVSSEHFKGLLYLLYCLMKTAKLDDCLPVC